MIEYAAMMRVATSLREREVSSSDWNSRVGNNLASLTASDSPTTFPRRAAAHGGSAHDRKAFVSACGS